MSSCKQVLNIQLAVLLAVALASGCGGSGTSPTREKEISHVGAITTLFFRATSALAKPPANEQEFKEAIARDNVDPGVLGVGSVDELFTSDRDGKPLIILYGPAPKGVAAGIVVYEQEGLNGVRLVGSSNGQIQEADAATFAKLVPQPATPQ